MKDKREIIFDLCKNMLSQFEYIREEKREEDKVVLKAILIMKKDDRRAWIFKLPNSYLFIKYENDNLEIKPIENREDVRNEIVNLSKKSWEIIKNEEEW
jgi:hypothetical protein